MQSLDCSLVFPRHDRSGAVGGGGRGGLYKKPSLARLSVRAKERKHKERPCRGGRGRGAGAQHNLSIPLCAKCKVVRQAGSRWGCT